MFKKQIRTEHGGIEDTVVQVFGDRFAICSLFAESSTQWISMKRIIKWNYKYKEPYYYYDGVQTWFLISSKLYSLVFGINFNYTY